MRPGRPPGAILNRCPVRFISPGLARPGYSRSALQSDPDRPPFRENLQTGSVPPLTPAPEPPPRIETSPPRPGQPSGSAGGTLAALLSGFLALFLADALLSLADDSLVLFFDVDVLTGLRGLVALCALLMAGVVYVLMGLTPAIPKRLFLPLALFQTVAGLITIPCLIYFHGRIQQVAWAMSFYQVMLALIVLWRVQHGFQFRWPILEESQLVPRGFSLRHSAVFLLVNVFVLVPGVVIYFACCASLAVGHFSEGFMALRPEGLIVQARKYVRDDGRTVHLFPMSHIGETDFYQKLSKDFPTNAIILMEGVSDDRGLITNRISYAKMAKTLGVAEQQDTFVPKGELVRADVDVSEFASRTIDFLNLVMFLQTKGLTEETLALVMQYSEPQFERQLFEDILHKRNRHLLKEIETRLARSEHLIVPWGAAHMPEVARGILNSGFRVAETQDYVAIRFRGAETNRLRPP